jgi:hypothetical protein
VLNAKLFEGEFTLMAGGPVEDKEESPKKSVSFKSNPGWWINVGAE